MTTIHRSTRVRLVTAIVIAVLAAGCSDDGGDNGGDTGATNAADGTGGVTTQEVATTLGGVAPGTITVSTTAITGQNGKMLLVFATSATQEGQLGVACIPITSDSFEVPSTALTEVPAGNPCAGGTPTVVFPEGSYAITAGIYTPGSQSAEAEVATTVDIAGDGVASVQLVGSALSG